MILTTDDNTKMIISVMTNTLNISLFLCFSEVDDEGAMMNPMNQPAANAPKPVPREPRVNPNAGAYRGAKCVLPDDFLQVSVQSHSDREVFFF